jgi:hypothetical protein
MLVEDERIGLQHRFQPLGGASSSVPNGGELGLVVEEVKPFGLAGSAGSTPLRITVEGDSLRLLFGKLYARSPLRADRCYKLGRELLHGRLEDESRSTPSAGWSCRRTTRCGYAATPVCRARHRSAMSS